MAKVIEVQILGKSFIFNLPADMKMEDFHVISRYVEDKMAKIRADAIELDSFKLGLLTSLNIAEELLSLKKENENLKSILNKIDTIISPMDEEIKSKEEKKVPIRFSS